MYIDLHIHSFYSDGVLTPGEIVEILYNQGIKGFSITDHDTIIGLNEAKIAADNYNLELVPGVEISTFCNSGKMHILGYFFDINSKPLLDLLEKLRNSRNIRNPKIVNKLNEMGMKITMEDVKKEAKGKVMGRPHIARVMKDLGYVHNYSDAFDIYIGEGKPAYFPKEVISPEEAVSIIKKAGGLSFLAHPNTLNLRGEALYNKIKELKDIGLNGIEAIYIEHSEKQIKNYLDIAKKLNLLVSGGSDFHNINDKHIPLGDFKVPYKYLKRIKNYLNNLNL